jgi:NAD(P)-dependent dehydrogenase (short-subunit alcohol dehydrogenase family)
MTRFTDRVAVVTGAAQGIGEAYAKALGTEGAKVVVADINADGAERVAAEIGQAGGVAVAVGVDVSDEASTLAMAAAATAAFGGIDHLVNNAALYAGMRVEPLLTVDLDYYRKMMSVNLDGVLLCTRACYGSMVDRGGGSIVNQSSIAAYRPSGYYSLSKAGLNSLTMSLASELSPHGVRVNAIAPGFIDTPATRGVIPEKMLDSMVKRTMLKRIGRPEDVVGTCLFLLSDDAAYVTGQVVLVDGGDVIRL